MRYLHKDTLCFYVFQFENYIVNFYDFDVGAVS